MQWRSQLAPEGLWSSQEIHPALKRGREKRWRHFPGDEWLAANPIHVPGLPSILRAAVSENQIDPQSNGFTTLRSPNESEIARDPFLQLPQELRDNILDYLDGDDVAPLRLASRAFNQIPLRYFRHLVQREIPCLYELWSDEPPSPWTTVNQRAMDKYELAEHQWYADLTRLRRVIQEEMPELADDWQAAEPHFRDMHPHPGFQPEIVSLPSDRTNWLALYKGIRIGLRVGQLKGLQNREKIWNDVTRIVGQIKELRQAGKMVDE
jgi:hypothetical protein